MLLKIYMKIVAFDEIYNFLVLSFLFRNDQMLKTLINFYDHNNRVLVLVDYKNNILYCMLSNEDTFYIKVVALNEIYDFIVFGFYIEVVKTHSKNNIKF